MAAKKSFTAPSIVEVASLGTLTQGNGHLITDLRN